MRSTFDSLPTPQSPLSRLDPRWKLAGILLLALVVAFLHTLAVAAAALGAALGLVLLARLPARWYLARLGAVAVFLVLMSLLVPWGAAVLVCLKALAILSLMLVLLASAPLNSTLKAAHALRVPGLLIQLAMLSYRYVFVLGGELSRLRVALRVRGYRNRLNRHSYRTVGHVAGTLLVRGYERAERVEQAMRCRGFDGRFRALTPFRTTAADGVFFVVLAGGAFGLLVWDVVCR
jgi:cobalt/nickel transport system permease protein